jgi:hypothetical protein
VHFTSPTQSHSLFSCTFLHTSTSIMSLHHRHLQMFSCEMFWGLVRQLELVQLVVMEGSAVHSSRGGTLSERANGSL